jgi:hypothetical protein
MENLDQEIRKKSFASGLVLGVITLVLAILAFYFMTTMTTSFWMVVFSPVIFSILIPIGAVIFFCIDLRKKIGGYWVFKQATTGIFIMLLVSFVVTGIGRDLIFAKVVEPQMVQKMEDAMVNATTSFMEKSNVDQATIDEKVESVKAQFESQKSPTIGKTIQGYVITLIFLFVLALIFGAIFKRTSLKPVGEHVDPAV